MKRPFSPESLEELLTELYQLDDVQLSLAAASLAADLRSWLEEQFILSPSQISYIAAMDNRQIAATAQAGQYFMTNRLPIVLIKKPQEKLQTFADEGKFFELKKETTSSYAPVVGYSEEELLTVHIYYS